MEGNMDVQCETIIPLHYPVAGYKKDLGQDVIRRNRMGEIPI